MNQQEQAKSLWEKQKNWKALINPLLQDREIHSIINNLLITSYWDFRQQKGIPKGTYNPEIDFLGFNKFEDFSEESKMGHCESETTWQAIEGKKVKDSEKGTISIFIAQKYLLSYNKLGMDKLISDYKETYKEKGELRIEWGEKEISFNELIRTMAHELAHAYQNTINLKKDGEKSQCESSGKKDEQGNLLYPELVAEHTQLTAEIKQMMESSKEYQEFKSFWKEGKKSSSPAEKENKEINSKPSSSFSDKIKGAANKAGDTSSQGVKKVGEGLGKAGQKLQDSADQSQWPRWVLPIGIGLGILLLLGIIVASFRRKR